MIIFMLLDDHDCVAAKQLLLSDSELWALKFKVEDIVPRIQIRDIEG